MIMFVDDDQAKRYACCRPLRKAGFTVLEVESGAEALRALPRVRPSVLVCDSRLSDMDGYDLCQQAKSLVNLPVMLVSTRPKDADKAKAAGVDDYIDNYALSHELVERVSFWRSKAKPTP